ncbi:hypothetical protein [Streptacidiphilus sp. PAMC 29251]
MPPAVHAVTRRWGGLTAPQRLALTVLVLCQALFLVHWAAFWPALYSPDSFTYVWQVTTGNWVSDHSIAYDSLVWLSLKGTGNLWLLTLLQTFVASLLMADTAVSLHRIGVRARWTVIASALVVLLPSTGTFFVFIWKDVPYVLGGVLMFSGCILLAGVAKDGNLRRAADRAVLVRPGLWRLTAGFAAILVFRNNSYPAVIVVVVGILLLVPGVRLKVLAAGAVTTAVALVLTLFVYPAAGVKLPHEDAVLGINIADIAFAYKDSPSSFTPADVALMAQVAPLSHWRGRAANCWDADWAMAAPMNRPEAAAKGPELLSLWTRILLRTPQDIAKARICRSQIAWGVVQGPTSVQGQTNIKVPWVTKAMMHWTYDNANWSYHGSNIKQSPYWKVLQKQHPLSYKLNSFERKYSVNSTVASIQWIVWRGAIWCYILYALVLRLAWVRRNKVWLLLLLPTLSLQLTVIAASPAQVWRYMAGPLMIGVLSLPLATITRSRDRKLAERFPAAPDVEHPEPPEQEIIAAGKAG